MTCAKMEINLPNGKEIYPLKHSSIFKHAYRKQQRDTLTLLLLNQAHRGHWERTAPEYPVRQ